MHQLHADVSVNCRSDGRDRRDAARRDGRCGMISKRIYMKLDWGHAGIPVCVADSPSELARLCGTSLSTVSHAVAKSQKNPAGKSWYVGVWTRWSNREYKEYFGEVHA